MGQLLRKGKAGCGDRQIMFFCDLGGRVSNGVFERFYNYGT